MRKFISVFIIALVSSASLSAHAGFCSITLMALRGPKLYRDAGMYSQKVRDASAAARADSYPNEYWTLAKDEGPVVQILKDVITKLAVGSGLGPYLSNPLPISIVIEKDGDHGPRASMQNGEFSVNPAMLRLAQDDDELAEIVGHELLHHTLAHSLELIKASQSRTTGFLRARSESDIFGGGQNVFAMINGTLARRRIDKLEDEVHNGIILLLENAGYNPYGIVRLWRTQAKEYERIGRPYYDWSNINDIKKIIEKIEKRLLNSETNPRRTRVTETMDKLRVALTQLPEHG